MVGEHWGIAATVLRLRGTLAHSQGSPKEEREEAKRDRSSISMS